jgi:hypothetical protein
MMYGLDLTGPGSFHALFLEADENYQEKSSSLDIETKNSNYCIQQFHTEHHNVQVSTLFRILEVLISHLCLESGYVWFYSGLPKK